MLLPCQACKIWISALPTVCSSSLSRTGDTSSNSSFLARASPLEVQLFEEDLCSSVSLGDLVDVVGQACMKLQPQAAAVRCTADIQVLHTSTTPSFTALSVLRYSVLLHYVHLHLALLLQCSSAVSS